MGCYWCGKTTKDGERFCSKACEDQTVCSSCHHDKFCNWRNCEACAKEVRKENLNLIKMKKEENQYIDLLFPTIKKVK